MGRPKNFTREEVLEKALPLFWKRGFANTGLQDLEEATGVNKSGLYSEFKDKDELFLEVLRHYTKTRDNFKILELEPLGWHNLDAFVAVSFKGKSETPGCFCVNAMREVDVLPAEAPGIIAANGKTFRQLILNNIASEKTKMPAESLADIVATFFSGLCIENNLKSVKSSATLKKAEDFLKALRSL